MHLAFTELLDKAAKELKLQHQRELDDNAAALSLHHEKEKDVLTEELHELRAQLGKGPLNNVCNEMCCGIDEKYESAFSVSSVLCGSRRQLLDKEMPVAPLRCFHDVVLHAAADDEDGNLISQDAVLEDVDSVDPLIMPPEFERPKPPSASEDSPIMVLEPSTREQTRTLRSSRSLLDLPPPKEPAKGGRRPSYFDLPQHSLSSTPSDTMSYTPSSSSWNTETPQGVVRSSLKRRTMEYATLQRGGSHHLLGQGSTLGKGSPLPVNGRSPLPHNTYNGERHRAMSLQQRMSVMSVQDQWMGVGSNLFEGAQQNAFFGNRSNRTSFDMAFAGGELHPEIMALAAENDRKLSPRMSTTSNAMSHEIESPGLRRKVTWMGEEGENSENLGSTETVQEDAHEDDEEDVIEMLAVWKFRRKSSLAQNRLRGESNRNSFKQVVPQSRGFESEGDSEMARKKPLCCIRCLTRCILKPSSTTRLMWDVIGVLLIFYDLFWIPMQVFDPESTRTTTIVAWTSTIFWSLDIPASFLVGYHNEGVLEMRLPSIARHYCKTWLSFDIVIILIDWTLTLMELVTENAVKGSGGVGYMRLGKAVRFLRLLRLLRLLKASGVLKEMLERIQSEAVLILVGIGKLLLLILMINHLIACAWYGLGTVVELNTWVDMTEIQHRTLLYQYSTSLHWSLTQFTPASMEVFPQNEVERCFAVTVILTAMVAFSSFVSAITNAMTQLRNLNSERNTQFAQLRKYFAENKVSVPIMGRIYCCLQQAMSKSKSRVHENEVTILQLLPWSLKSELLEEVYSPILNEHPFFAQLGACHPMLLRKLLQSAIEEGSKPIGQELFIAGDAGMKMYFVLSGMLQYKKEKDMTDAPIMLSAHQWCSEPALWIRWKHVGHLLATSHCELVTLNSMRLGEVLSQLKEDEDQVKRYVRIFVRYFKKFPEYLHDAWADKDVIEGMTFKAFNYDDLDDEEGSRPTLKSQKSFFGRRRQSFFNSLNSPNSVSLRRTTSNLQVHDDLDSSCGPDSEDEDSDSDASSTHSVKSKVSVVSTRSKKSTTSSVRSKKSKKEKVEEQEIPQFPSSPQSRKSSVSSKVSSAQKTSSNGSNGVILGETMQSGDGENSPRRKNSNGRKSSDGSNMSGQREIVVTNSDPTNVASQGEAQPRWLARKTSEAVNNEIDQWLDDLPTWNSMRSSNKKEIEPPKSKVARFFGWTHSKSCESDIDMQGKQSLPTQGCGSGSSMKGVGSGSSMKGTFKQLTMKRASTVSMHDRASSGNAWKETKS